ncbi:MAG: hypothetical protein LBM02_09760 [Lachnospiraceae bacterium]|nr:hypothetical protein [Lachnospiraceae bacterium]
MAKEEVEYIQKMSEPFFVEIPANNSVEFRLKILDSIQDCTASSYPIIEKGKTYSLQLKADFDSSIMDSEKRKKYNILFKNRKLKLFMNIRKIA